MRGRCLMLAGQCPAGKDAFRKALEKSAGATLGPAQLDGKRKDAAFCMAAYATAKRLVSSVKPKDEDDPVKFVFANVRTNAPKCLARAHDCAAALTVYKEAWKLDPLMPEASKNIDEQGLRVGFDAVVGGPGSCPKTATKQSWEK